MKTGKHKIRSLHRSFTLSILWVHMTVLLLALLTGFFTLFSISRKQTINDGKSDLDYLAWQMDYLTDSLYKIRNRLIQDDDICNYLISARSWDAEDILLQKSVMEQLSLFASSYSYISSITLFPANGPALSVGSSRQVQGKAEDMPFPIQQTDAYASLSHSSSILWGGIYSEAELFPARYKLLESDFVVSVLLPLNSQTPLSSSALSVNIPLEYFDFMYRTANGPDATILLYDQDGTLLLSVPNIPEDSDSSVLDQEELKNLQPQDRAPVSALSSGMLLTRQLSGSGWYLAETIPTSRFLREMIPLQGTVSLIFCIATFFSILISSIVGHKLLNPFTDIVTQMDRIDNENLEQRITPLKYRELNYLIERFNFLMDRIQKLVQTNRNMAEEQRRLEMESLQSQINPHFLFNSLTTIRWMASMARAENVCNALLALSNVIRPVFSQPGILWELETELNFIQNYIDIMDYRFGIQTKYVKSIPAEFLHRPVLRFILQPIVENALLHGLRPRMSAGESCEIRIHAKAETPWLNLYITDNGQGMSPETVVALNERLQNHENIGMESPDNTEEHSSIGLFNVNRRLFLQYGKGSGLNIRSLLFQETEVRVRIPLQEFEDKPDPSQGLSLKPSLPGGIVEIEHGLHSRRRV